MTPDESIARDKLAIETKLKRTDQALAREQFEWQKKQATHTGWAALLSPTGVVLAGAAIGLLGTAAGKWADYQTTKRQQETNIILKASEVPASLSPGAQDEQRARNLLWFEQAGYIVLPKNFVDQLTKASNLKPGETVPPPVVQSQMTEAGVNLIEKLEGFKSAATNIGPSLKVIGYAHTLSTEELSSGKIQVGSESIRFQDGITEGQAKRILDKDLAPCYANIHTLVKVPLTQGQMDALAIFCFNIGIIRFSRNDLIQHLNEGDYAAVPEDMKKLTIAGGKPIPGLVMRRQMEVDLWSKSATDAK